MLSQMDVMHIAAAVVIFVLIWKLYICRYNEGFMNEQEKEVFAEEIQERTGDMFKSGGASMSKFKDAMSNASQPVDAVVYTDMKELHREGKFNKDAIKATLT